MARLSFSAILAVLAFLNLASAAPTKAPLTLNAIRNPQYRPDGRLEYARALAKWGGSIPDALANYALSKTKGDTGVVSAQSFVHDREYLTPIGIGTPAQTLMLDLDTGSSDFWVYSSETDPTILGNRTRYVTADSSTSRLIPNSSWSIEYGDGSFAMGDAHLDTIHVGGIEVQDAVVETAKRVSDQMAADLALNGIFGLAYGLGSEVTPRVPTVYQKMSPLLHRNVFTADLKFLADGTYQFGAIDHSKFTGDIHWTPLMADAKFWQFDFSSFNVENSNTWYWYKWSAIADTGTSLMLMGNDMVKYYYSRVKGATFNESTGLWVYPCSTVLPDFNFGLGNGSSNWTATVPGRFINYTVYDAGATGGRHGHGVKCMGGIQGNGGANFSILGDVFLKAFYAIFDVAGRRVGFADKPLN
ncbi:aspartic peptidase domain-containing protein [Podospora aff. communis PSN243]|uniref:Aspartic peptidase domain-containing protein n=1 Tax=Podospora aff. communis PSN243 TaxID=3040156 RepID=A0AAV9GAJ6_9PEZI|nr:aspartic peptidase domain-containing protein [Podospora aff. communis PSN243]